ncbi:MAG: Hsp33 family molecular chaperone HslO [Firmicutes bacterium]|nr:Hsp33 family molecular chaperone HslO [Bacillota bacterium]
MKQQDYLVRAVLGANQARVFALRTTNVAREAQARHLTSPTASAALGRSLTIGLVLGAMLKGEETVTIQIKGDGPLKGIVASANSRGEVKGYVGNPFVDLPLNREGKLAVGEAVGSGNLYVLRDLGLKDVYQGAVPLQTGEIGDDFAYYFAHSEQIPSAVVLGVLVGLDQKPIGAGGIVLQLLPDAAADQAFIDKLEAKLANMSAISSFFAADGTPEDILEEYFSNLNPRIIDTSPVRFRCDCSRERFEKGLLTLGRAELQELVDLEDQAEIVCHFCTKSYYFSNRELKAMIRELDT